MRLATLILSSVIGALQVPVLTDADVSKAIALGEANKHRDLFATCGAGTTFGEGFSAGMVGGIQPSGTYVVTFSGTAGRLAVLAAEAKRLYKAFTVADVPADLRQHWLVVAAEPNKPGMSGSTYEVTSPMQAMVLRARGDKVNVVQPAKLNMEPVEWANLMGGKIQGTRGAALFDLDKVRAIAPGELEVVLVTEAGERRCRINSKDRDRVMR